MRPAAPAPATAARLPPEQPRALLRKAGRSRGTDAAATRPREAFRLGQMPQPPLAEQATGHQARAPIRQLGAACRNAGHLEHAATESF
ncbi:MAG TPA: hypothetical protein VFQ44_17360 [Streptosporangiaceae bacterium]|nr:hypothetical protein [Streptosporangiaceae bacterium]